MTKARNGDAVKRAVKVLAGKDVKNPVIRGVLRRMALDLEVAGLLSGSGEIKLPKKISWNQAVVMIDEMYDTVDGTSPAEFVAAWNACLDEVKKLNKIDNRKGE